ncbi:PilZ domain-containing protein [Pseudoruegeria sp. HB172150]|uniref:PilZ domain-containing protein n=1 Tax=Pseudoruegeria sp. HB172150 TaxID=2721164 RepID=UPI0015523179|nr:PilZ domain-containing protein [Pseudoruegeria sp. HB172150]
MASDTGFPELDRLSLNLPCRVFTEDDVYAARLVDLSYGGACVEAPDLPEFTPSGLTRIEALGLGTLDVIFRWRRGARIGVSFRSDFEARPILEAFFAAQGEALTGA